MDTLSERIFGLSPAKQRLLELRRQKHIAIKQYPLSYGQKRLWFLDQLQPGNSAYNIVLAVSLEGPLNATFLQKALTELVRRHEVLRTRFGTAKDTPFQQVLPPSEQHIELIDLTSVVPEEQKEQCLLIVGEEGNRHFDLAQGGLFLAKLVRLAPNNHLLVLNIHHILSDGWSTAVMVRELTVLYAASAQGKESPLPELPMQYGDFALWQEKWLQSSWLHSQLNYWIQQLAGSDELIELPLDHPPASESSWKGAVRRFALDSPKAVELRALARTYDCTLYMVLLAAFSALLFRYAGQTHVNVGTPIAGRNKIELENLIGFFVNTLVMRTDFSAGPSFAKLLGQVRSNFLEAQANQNVPFEMVVEALRPEREANSNPLFQVMFVFQNLPPAEVRLPGLVARTFPAEKTTTKFHLTLTMMEQAPGITGLMDYRDDLFAAATIERMIGHFQVMLGAIISDPDQEVSRLPFLTDEERTQVLEEWNNSERVFRKESCIHQLFEDQVLRTPDAVAVEFEGQELTYRELNRRAIQVARGLIAQGVGPEARVGLFMDRGIQLITAVLGVLKAGGAFVPLERGYPRERLRYMLEDARIAVLLTDVAEKASDLYGGAILALDPQWREIENSSRQDLEEPADEKNLAYVLYTSGSTGQPKGVCIEHRQLVNYVLAMTERMGNQPCSFAMVQPLTVDASLTALFPPLLTGGCVHVISRECSLDVECMKKFFADHDVKGLKVAPSHLIALHRAAGEKKADLMPKDLLVIGGESSAWSWIKELQQMAPGCAVLNHYGPTETTVGVLTYRYGEEYLTTEYRNTPLGRPLGNTQVYVLDRGMNAVPVGVRGEIYVGGANVGRGYLAQPSITAEKFVPNPFSRTEGQRLYRTGDYGKWTASGQVEFLGRRDDQIKIRGHRVECAEIEAVLARYPGVHEVLVLGQKNRDGDQLLVAYIVARGNPKPQTLELREYLKEYLPQHMVPAAFMVLEALPLTPHGKFDRRALPAPDLDQVETRACYVAPRTETEEKLAGIFRELLGIEKIGIRDNFFALGGHSLLATRVIARIRSQLNVELSLRVLFDEPTVAGLAERAVQQHPGTKRALPVLVRAARDGPLPLSYAQQRLWFIDQLNHGSAAYNMAFAVELSGDLDKDALRRSMREIVRRHDVFRTGFPQRDGIPVQEIVAGLELSIEEIDLRPVTAELRELQATRMAEQEARRAFDLSQAPLLRGRLLQLAEQQHVLVVTMHHIVSDGWSMGILVREFAALYSAYHAGQNTPLAELELQYADYGLWQRGWLQGEVLEEQVSYWRKELTGVVPLELPTERGRSELKSNAGAVVEWDLGQELSRQLQELSQAAETTLFMTLLTGWQLLLSRYSGQEDLTVGTPVAGRRWIETEPLIGFFVNTLVLRARVKRGKNFRQLLSSVRQTTLAAYEHQDLPFEKLVEELKPERDLGRTPLFQVMLQMQNVDREELQLPGLKVTPISVSTGTEKFDLTLGTTVDGRGNICGRLSYRTDLFSENGIRRMLSHFENLLREAVSDPQKRIEDLAILSPAERHHLLYGLNQTETVYPQCTIHELFQQQVERTPEAIALEYEGEWLTYHELNRRANQLANFLQNLGVGPEVLVTLCVERGLHMVVGILAILKAGGAYVPLDPAYPKERLSWMLADSGPAVVLTQGHLRDLFTEIHEKIPVLDLNAAGWTDKPETNPEAEVVGVTPQNVAYVIYTSGSTGRPKGVSISHQALVNKIWTLNQYLQVSAMTRYAALSSISFDPMLEQIFCPLCAGGTSVIIAEEARYDADHFIARLNVSKVSVLNVSPAIVEYLFSDHRIAGYLDTVIVGADVFPAIVANRLREAQVARRILNFYGPTEACVDATGYEIPQEQLIGSVSIGRPLPNYRIYVLDGSLKPLPIGVVGELYIGGAGLARGYLNRPELTAERFVPDPHGGDAGQRLYRTGDLGRWLENGIVEFVGRNDFQIKIRGFRIELCEIEARLLEYSGVREATVLAHQDSLGGKYLVAYVAGECDDGKPIEGREARRYLQDKLPEYMVPAVVVAMDKLPLTSSGKVDRRSLPMPDRRSNRTYRPPSTPEEQILCEIFAEVLKQERVSADDDFFELAGHSLLAVRLLAQIERRTKKKLPLATVFQHSSIERLAALLRDQQVVPSRSPIIEMKKGKSNQPLFFVHGAGGSAFAFNNLARYLHPIHPFMAFQDPGIDEPGTGATSIEAMAAVYIKAMREIQPVGPYALGGWSMGGLVAFEMGRQLRAQNQRISFLALIDSYLPSGEDNQTEDEELLFASFLLTSGFNADDLKKMGGRPESLEQCLARAQEIGMESGVLPAGTPPGTLQRYFEVYRRHVRAGRNFKPQPTDVTAHLWYARENFQSAERRESAWKNYVFALYKSELPGNHFTLLREPYVITLALHLSEHLTAANIQITPREREYVN